jgi:WD40 repeat protein
MLAAGGYGFDVWLWNTSDWKLIAPFREELWVNSLVFTADNRRLITASNRMTVHSRDVATGQLCFRFHGHEGPVTSVALSRDGRILATGSHDNTIRLWRAATPEEVRAAGW